MLLSTVDPDEELLRARPVAAAADGVRPVCLRSDQRYCSNRIKGGWTLRLFAETGLPLIVSKGMATLGEVDKVVRFLRPRASGLAMLGGGGGGAFGLNRNKFRSAAFGFGRSLLSESRFANVHVP